MIFAIIFAAFVIAAYGYTEMKIEEDDRSEAARKAGGQAK